MFHLFEDEAIQDIPTAWLKLYLLSLRYFKPNKLNFDNIFSVLPNLAWTNNGPMRAENLSDLNLNEDLKIFAETLKGVRTPCARHTLLHSALRLPDVLSFDGSIELAHLLEPLLSPHSHRSSRLKYQGGQPEWQTLSSCSCLVVVVLVHLGVVS